MRLVSIMYLIILLQSTVGGVYRVCNGNENQCISIGLSKKNTDAVKGILAVAVLLSHLAGHTSYHLLFFSFTVFGPIGVGCFFFLSGYGLIKASRGKNYFEGYVGRHMLKLFMPFCTMLILWLIVFQVLLNEPLSSLLYSFATGNPVSNSWYIFASLYCYLLFWVTQNQPFWRIQCIVLVGLVIWAFLFAFVLAWPDWWYKTIICFYVGIVWGKSCQKISGFIRHNYILLVILSIIAVFAAYTLPAWAGKMFSGKLLWLMNDMAMALSGVIFMVFILERVCVRNTLTVFWGKISFYIYLLHGLVMRLADIIIPGWGSAETSMLKQELISVSVISVTIILSLIMTIVTDRIRLYMRLKRVH